MSKYKSWQCQKCGANVGWLGRLLRMHTCQPLPSVASEGVFTLHIPQPTHKLQLCGNSDLVFTLFNGPNGFHRWMQRILLGFVWTKL